MKKTNEIKENKKLNTMCNRCLCLGRSCSGTTCQVWTGCIERKLNKEGEHDGSN